MECCVDWLHLLKALSSYYLIILKYNKFKINNAIIHNIVTNKIYLIICYDLRINDLVKIEVVKFLKSGPIGCTL